MSRRNFRPPVVLITGAGRGIGRGTALALANAGCRLGLVDRDPANLEAVAAELRGLGAIVGVASADVLGSFDNGQAKVEITFVSAPTGPILSYDVYFSKTAVIGSVDLNTPLATINVGVPSCLACQSASSKHLVPTGDLLAWFYHVQCFPWSDR